MSFLNQAGAAECGPVNPMSGLLKQFQRDRSLQQDRFMGAQQGESSKAGFRSRPMQTSFNDRQVWKLSEEFLQENVAMERPAGVFDFHGLSGELKRIEGDPQLQHGGMTGGDWAADFMQQQPMLQGPPPEQFEEFEKIYQQNHHAQAHNWHEDFAAFQANHPEQIAMSDNEKAAFERAFDEAKQGAQVDWESEFAAQEMSWADEFAQQEGITDNDANQDALARTAAMLLESVDVESNPKFKNSQFMNLMRKLRDSEVSIQGDKMVETKGKQSGWATEFEQQQGNKTDSQSWTNDFLQHAGNVTSGNMWSNEFAQKAERGWADEFQTTAGPSSAVQNDWAAEFSKQSNMSQTEMHKLYGRGTDTDDWVQQYQRNIAHLKTAQDAEWDSMQKDWDRYRPEQGLGYRADKPQYHNYTFVTNNPYLMNPAAIDNVEHASLADSILALEAKAQLQVSNADAWKELGLKQQENERDVAAIAALRRAVSMSPSSLDAWLALAVSFTNENCRADAYDALEQWMVNNEKYQHLVRQDAKRLDPAVRHSYITNMFLEAARTAPGEEMDANVQVGLGILFNVSEEYDKAIDCFKAALASRPQDYVLWNKLGATLANSRDTAGAIDAYFHALEISPSYVRARYNLAISCINLGQRREAAEHLLTALALQQAGDAASGMSAMVDEHGQTVQVPGGMSDNVWDSLRMLMFMMNREDLVTACDRRNIDAFRHEFDF
ncbi:uncharacterized protein BYT42DRAFT_590459 [Radiomyces spectabilis]|uniref:uncharacterized protein n=1 Tax=Radiomyces spectabilis TaxID=64574 RepID=UPI00221FBC7F|nr:uncharacterized protein BYT42DRAFT_590459 [Radiomyces spectabilis]KAI8364795.1 hypothetical protein BYT42DRAFT_590459 [Radiomyces spectabilis]